MNGIFGMTATMFMLSPYGELKSSVFKDFIKNLDNYTNRNTLVVFKKDLSELIKFLENLPFQYENREDKITYAKLLAKKYKDDNEKELLEKSLEGKSKVLSPSFGISGSNLSKVSNEAKIIINKLLVRLNNAKRFESLINVSSTRNSDESALGEKVYRLKTKNRSQLVRLFSDIYSQDLDSKLFLTLQSDVKLLFSKLSDIDERDSEINTKSANIKKWLNRGDSVANSLDINYLNGLIGVELSEDDYFNLSKELNSYGLVGFSIYTPEFNKEFRKTFSESFADTKIYPNTDLYDFVLDLNKTLNSIQKFIQDVEEEV